MAKKRKNINSEILCDLLKSPEFMSLSDDLKITTLENLKNIFKDETKKDAGIMGKLFGNRAENTSLYIAFIVATLLITVGLIYIFFPPEYKATTNSEFWQIIGPIISGTLGYIFGSSSKE